MVHLPRGNCKREVALVVDVLLLIPKVLLSYKSTPSVNLSIYSFTFTACTKQCCFDFIASTELSHAGPHTTDKQPFSRLLIIYTQREQHPTT